MINKPAQHALILSYLFPPMGGVGVQRTLKFVKYLPEYGWIPNVVTARLPKKGLRDEGLLNEIPAEVQITRTSAILPPQYLPWRVRDLISRWMLLVDEQVGWLPFATRAGLRIIKENPVEVIYSTSAPYTAHLVACELHKKTKIPWVADFRDPWIGNTNLRFPTPLHRKLVERLERQVIRECSHILVVSPPMAQNFHSRISEIPPTKITCLPNGYDATDFVGAQPANRDSNRFLMVYTGSFYAQGKTARTILHAVQLAIQQNRLPRERFRLQLVGSIGKSTQKWISALNLDDVVDTPGFVSHGRSIACLLAADALLLIIGDSVNSSVVYTSKIFEYLAARKPILCLANSGVAADLICDAKAGVIVPPDDIPQITQRLVDMYQQWQQGNLSITPDQALIQTYERRRQTGELAKIFTSLARKTS